jgi:hypothetical protein
MKQCPGDDRPLLAATAANRMVDNASELAARLSGLTQQHITIVRMVFCGELHSPVSYSLPSARNPTDITRIIGETSSVSY